MCTKNIHPRISGRPPRSTDEINLPRSSRRHKNVPGTILVGTLPTPVEINFPNSFQFSSKNKVLRLLPHYLGFAVLLPRSTLTALRLSSEDSERAQTLLTSKTHEAVQLTTTIENSNRKGEERSSFPTRCFKHWHPPASGAQLV